MNIGFDLDRVFINYPPFIPARVIDWLYRRHFQKTLSYSIPRSVFSKTVRRISHMLPLRPQIKPNIDFIKKFPNNYNQLYLISSRYKFLEKLTHKLLERVGLNQVFHAIFLNTENKQPHHFKEEVIKNNKIELYIDDDLALLTHLYKTCPQTKLLWYNPHHQNHPHNGIITITNLSEVTKFIK